MISPKHLPVFKDWQDRNYDKYRCTYGSYTIKVWKKGILTKINGRKVKYWKLVYRADDVEGDRYIPIFFKKKKQYN